MTVDPLVYALAAEALRLKGWTYSEDVKRLTEAIKDTIEDFITDIENGPQE